MRVALFATCLVDLLRPSVGFAAVKLLEQAGCEVVVPLEQTCCGQPAYNNGDKQTAIRLAKQLVDSFYIYDYLVVPSGSCGGMIKLHYPELLKAEPAYHTKATELAGRCYELTSFLVDVLKHESLDAAYEGELTYHDSCSSLRELGIKQQPRRLLNNMSGCQLNEMANTENCCGFGGTFCVKYSAISTRMVDDKVNNIKKSGADTLVAADLGCLLNIAGRIKRLGLPIKVFHVAEVLAGMAEGPGIGEDESL
ncbi:MAG: (Fe-S)-binding protein [Halobacteria archaeon]|nr:(Fe-S)-binding protein [Halobacteria archaeon]